MKRKGNIDHIGENSVIRYANVWEDAHVLRQGLFIQPGDRVLSIASGGDNCLAMLCDDPSEIVATDINPAQLHLVRLKISAIRYLERDEALYFLGYRETPVSQDRIGIFNRLKGDLPSEARMFWENRYEAISAGIIHSGKFEKYFRIFANYVLPLIHRKKTTLQLIAPKSAEEQIRFYNEKWNTIRWRYLFRLFFSRSVMGWLGRDRSFLKEVEVDVGSHIFQMAENHLTDVQAQHNFILRYNLTGSFGDEIPDYLQGKNFETVRSRLDRLTLLHGYIEDIPRSAARFNAMNLSDIFEYMDHSLFRRTGKQLLEIAAPGCRIAYWNLMVERRLSLILPAGYNYLKDLSEALKRKDRGFFYKSFITDQVK